jgi:hypothetical protein
MFDRNKPRPTNSEEEALRYGEFLERYRHTAVNLPAIINVEYLILEKTRKEREETHAITLSALAGNPERRAQYEQEIREEDTNLELLLASAIAAKGTLDILEEDPDSYRIYMAMCPYKRRDSLGWPSDDLVLEFLSLLTNHLKNQQSAQAPRPDTWHALQELRLTTLKRARVMYKQLRATLVMTN